MGEGAVYVDISTENTSRTELKREHHSLVDDSEPEPISNKKQAKEASNEDVRSEVSNPVISPKENGCSCQDITSQPTHAGACEVTSSCSGHSSPLDSLSEEGEHNGERNASHNGTSDSLSTSHVVLEIPKHASSSGIRKITFKFSKRKEDYDRVGSGIGQEQFCSEEHRKQYSAWADSDTEMLHSGDRYYCNPNMELKMSKKVVPNNYPSNVKKLLSTGILNGARVKYFSPEHKLDGIIRDGGYLCGCSSCNFLKVLNANEFEQHAGCKTRHPNNHIYLENGKPICSIIHELKAAPLGALDEAIKNVAGSSINEELFEIWKASFQRQNGMVGADRKCYSMLPCSPCSLGSYSSQGLEESFSPASSYFLHNNSFRQQKYMEVPEEHKRTTIKRPSSFMQQKKTTEAGTKRRDNDLHRLLFMPNGLPDGTELAYSVKGQKLMAGYKQGNGIVCDCCSREISPSQFEAHAGMAARRQPYRHIYTSNGLTLHDIAVTLASGQNVATGVSDDMCAKCGDGGDLIFCESCPRAFHLACLDLEHVPEDVWQCPSCIKSGHEGITKPIIIRLNRVVKTSEEETGGCVVCRAHDFSTGTFDDRTVILCDQCEREFHVGCLRETGVCDLRGLPGGNWYCSNECNRIYDVLRDSVDSGAQMIPTVQLNVITRKHAEKGLFSEEPSNYVQWQILMGKSRSSEDLKLLSAAASIFRECFDPIIATTGRDLIPVMVFGRNISGQEFSSTFCVVLIAKNVVVSAGLFRIFDKEVAELPLVATGREHQGKGYFQALFSCIERFLSSLNVVNLVLPAAEEAESIWTRRFGFRKMSEEQMSKYRRERQITIFKGTSMLVKKVPQIFEPPEVNTDS